MNKVCIVITGAGELGKAIGLLLVQHAPFEATYFLGDKDSQVVQQAAEWMSEGNTQGKAVHPFLFDAIQVNQASHTLFRAADLVIDCLPAPLTPSVARLARQHHAHYVNLTASAAEMDQIQAIATEASTAFMLQADIAPGLVNLLLKDLYQQYRTVSGCPVVDYAGIRVAMLPPLPVAGSPEATNQCAFLPCREAILISNVRQTRRSSVSIWETSEINGRYADVSMMAGGEGNLVEALADRVRQVGHPIQFRSTRQPKSPTAIANHDWLLAQAMIEGYDASGRPVTLLKSCQIAPVRVGHRWLSAPLLGRAVLLAECVQLLVTTHACGLIFANQLEPDLVLKGAFVPCFFGIAPRPEIIYQPSASD